MLFIALLVWQRSQVTKVFCVNGAAWACFTPVSGIYRYLMRVTHLYICSAPGHMLDHSFLLSNYVIVANPWLFTGEAWWSPVTAVGQRWWALFHKPKLVHNPNLVKMHFLLILFLIIWSDHSLSHVITAQLSYNMKSMTQTEHFCKKKTQKKHIFYKM